MATNPIDVDGFVSEFPALSAEVVRRIADEVFGEATLYAPQLLADAYVPPDGVKAILSRATRGQLIAYAEQGKGPAATQLTAGGMAIKLDKDGSSLFGDIFTKAQIEALRALSGSPQSGIGSLRVW